MFFNSSWLFYSSLKSIGGTFVVLFSSDFLNYWYISCNIFSIFDTLDVNLVCFFAETGDLIFNYFSEIRESSLSLIDFLDSIDLLLLTDLLAFFGVSERLYFLLESLSLSIKEYFDLSVS